MILVGRWGWVGGGGWGGGGGGLRRGRPRFVLLLGGTRFINGSVRYIFSIGMEVSVQKCAWVDAYLVFGCVTSYNTLIFNVSR